MGVGLQGFGVTVENRTVAVASGHRDQGSCPAGYEVRDQPGGVVLCCVEHHQAVIDGTGGIGPAERQRQRRVPCRHSRLVGHEQLQKRRQLGGVAFDEAEPEELSVERRQSPRFETGANCV